MMLRRMVFRRSLTRFVGRATQINDVRKYLADNRLVTLAGAGGVGKTRLAAQIAEQSAGEFGGGVWFVDLAPVTDPEVVPVAVLRAFGLPDQPGRSATDTLTRFVGDRDALVVLDNCEHLIDACGVLTEALLGACPRLTILATSRAPIGVPGELTWRVPSLSLTTRRSSSSSTAPGWPGRISVSPPPKPLPSAISADVWTACPWASSSRRRRCG